MAINCWEIWGIYTLFFNIPLNLISGIYFHCSLYQTLVRVDSKILRFSIEKPTDPLRFEEVEKSDNIHRAG